MSQTATSSTTDAITAAIGAHGLWKARLRQALDTGTSEFTPAGIMVDNACEFGRWLYSVPAAHQDPHWQKVRGLHAEFHRIASRTLGDALGADRARAEESLAPTGAYGTKSAELIDAMVAWKRSLA